MSAADKVIYCNGYLNSGNAIFCKTRALNGCRDGGRVCCFYCDQIKKCLEVGNGCGQLRDRVELYGNIFKLMIIGGKIVVRPTPEQEEEK
jgi:hypothetical protein